MSWRQYGGTNKLDKMNNINVNTISTDSFRLHGPYKGDFDICGNLCVDTSMTVFGSMNIKYDTVIERNTKIINDLIIYGNVFSKNNLVITDASLSGNINIGQNSYIGGNSTVYKNFFLWDTLYFDPSSTEFFHGENNKLGLNVYHPKATFDICGNISNVLNVHSNQEYTRNVLVENKNNRGITLNSNTNASYIDFFVDASTNPLNKYDGRIIQTSGGIITVDVSYNTRVLSNMSITYRNESDHIYDETLIVYDNSYGILHPTIYNTPTAISGNAASFIAVDNSSNTFIKLITPNNTGLNINGGAYPLDTTRSMASLNWIDASGFIIPSMMIVSGNNAARYRSTIGFNTYAPRTENYVVDINGPVHITNGQIKTVVYAEFQINSVSRLRKYQKNIISIGSPSSINNAPYIQQVYYSNDYGQSWNLSNVNPPIYILDNSGNILLDNDGNPILNINHSNVEDISNIFYSIFSYDTSFSIMLGSNSYGFYTLDGGQNWNQLVIPFGVNYKSIFMDISHVYFCYDNTLAYFNNPYTNAPPDNNGIKHPIQDQSSTYSITNEYVIQQITQSIYIKSIYGVSNKLFIAGNGIATYNILNTNALDQTKKPLLDLSYNINKYNYNSIHAYNDTNAVAVGVNIISYTKNGITWNDISLNSTFNSVYVFDTSYAIAVGNSASIYYTTDGYYTWKKLPNEILISSGNPILISDLSNNFTSITMSDPNTFIITSVTQYYNENKLGNSRIIYCYFPNLFNRKNNTAVFDLCGNMHISGDTNIENTLTVGEVVTMTKNEQSYGFSDGTLRVSGGAYITANTNIGGNLFITSPNYLFNTYFETSDASSGNINIGTLPPVGSDGIRIGRNINIGDVYNLTRKNTNINIGGPSDIIIIQSPIQIGSDTNATASVIINGNLRVSTPSNDYNYFYSQGSILKESTSPTNGLVVIEGGLGVRSNAYVGGNTVILGDIESTKIPSGTLIVTGGIGASGNLFLGGNSVISGNVNILKNTESVTISSGTLIVTGGVGISANTFIGGNVDISNNVYIHGDIESVNKTTGTVVITGGLGVSGNIFVGGNLTISRTTDSYNASSGVLIVKGGVGISGNLDMSGNLLVTGNAVITKSTESINPTTGTLIITRGGVGISHGNLFVGGNICITNTIVSLGTDSGALQVSGGVGIGGNVNIQQNMIIHGNLFLDKGMDASNNLNIGTLIIANNSGMSITSGNLYTGGFINIVNTQNVTLTNSDLTNYTSGCLTVAGGAGFQKDVYIGGNTTIRNYIFSIYGLDSSSPDTGTLLLQRNSGIGITTGNIFTGGFINITNTTTSTSTYDGVFIVSGGVGIGGNTFIGGNTTIHGNLFMDKGTESFSATSGTLIVQSGGIGITNGNLYVGGNIVISNTKNSLSYSSGVLIISGGVGIYGNTNIGGNVNIGSNNDPTIEALSTSTGSLTISGGTGILGNLYVGGNIVITRTSDSISYSTGVFLVSGGVGITGNTFNKGNITVENQLIINGTGNGNDLSSNGIINNKMVNLFNINGIVGMSYTYGSIVVNQGDIGAYGNVCVGDMLFVGCRRYNRSSQLKNSIDCSSGAFVVYGGAGITNDLYVGTTIGPDKVGNIYATSQAPSTAYNNGSIVVTNGVGIGGNLNMNGNLFITTNGNAIFANITTSTSTNTGALIVSGGVAIQKDVYIGKNTTMLGNLFVNDTTDSTDYKSGCVQISGGVGVNKTVNIQGNVYIGGASNNGNTLTVKSTTTNTALFNNTSGDAAIQIKSSAIGKNPYINFTNGTDGFSCGYKNDATTKLFTINNNITYTGTNWFTLDKSDGNTIVTSTSESTTTNSGALVVQGGIGIAKNVYVGGQEIIVNTTNATSTATGALQVRGGVGIGNDVYISGKEYIINTTDSTGTDSGALQVSGGVGISKNVYVAGQEIIINTTNSTTTNTGALQVQGGIGVKTDIYVGNLVTSTYFNAVSDYRIKTNIENLNEKYNVDKLRPVKYKNKISNKQDIGFIAHEVQEIYPFLVNGEKDGENNQSLNYTGLIGILVKEIQDLKKTVKEMQERIDKM